MTARAALVLGLAALAAAALALLWPARAQGPLCPGVPIGWAESSRGPGGYTVHQ